MTMSGNRSDYLARFPLQPDLFWQYTPHDGQHLTNNRQLGNGNRPDIKTLGKCGRGEFNVIYCFFFALPKGSH